MTYPSRPQTFRERLEPPPNDARREMWDALMEWEDNMLAFANEAAQNVDLLMTAMWAAYAASGADTDGDEEWHCTPSEAANSLIRAVTQLRRDYDDEAERTEVQQALNACVAEGRMVPMQTAIGSGFAIGNVTVIALPVERWEALVEAIDALQATNVATEGSST